MNSKPSFAVLLAAYNGIKYLNEQIQTILNQKNVDLTIFINVDCSKDGTEAWLKILAKREKRIILLPFGNKFGMASKNFFHLIRNVDFSIFDYVAFADQDDHWLPTKLYKSYEVLKNSNYQAYSSNVIAFWPNGRKLLISKSQKQKSWDYIFEAAGPGCTYVFSNNLISKLKTCIISNWEQVQELKLHDWFCYAFARSKGYNWYIDPKPEMLYRQHSANVVGANVGWKAYFKRFKEVKTGRWFQQISLIISILNLEQKPFIQAWSKFGRLDFLRLALRFRQCRRQVFSQLIFFNLCLLFAVIGLKKEKF